jgi:hypothetical protein
MNTDRLTLTDFPNRSVAVRDSIAPPEAMVRVFENLPSASIGRREPLSIRFSVRVETPEIRTVFWDITWFSVGEVRRMEGPLRRGSAL